MIARRGAPHGSGLGKTRWVVERAFAWLHQFKRLRIRYEIRADLHLGFLELACSIICLRRLLMEWGVQGRGQGPAAASGPGGIVHAQRHTEGGPAPAAIKVKAPISSHAWARMPNSQKSNGHTEAVH